MGYQQIAYVSLAAKQPSQNEIDGLLLDARAFNIENDITGVLLCHKNTFFQFFEGTPENVSKVYERIRKSGLHKNILELSNTSSQKRHFNNWLMGFCYIPQSEMQALIHAEWIIQIPIVCEETEESFGLKMLEDFWFRLAENN